MGLFGKTGFANGDRLCLSYLLPWLGEIRLDGVTLRVEARADRHIGSDSTIRRLPPHFAKSGGRVQRLHRAAHAAQPAMRFHFIYRLHFVATLLYQSTVSKGSALPPPRTGISLSPHGSGPLPQRRFAPPPTEVFTSPNGIQWISAATVAAGESKDRKGNGK